MAPAAKKGETMFGLGSQSDGHSGVAMLLFRAQKLPELARSLGKSVRSFRGHVVTGPEPKARSTRSARLCASCQTALQTEWSHCPGASVTTPTRTAPS